VLQRNPSETGNHSTDSKRARGDHVTGVTPHYLGVGPTDGLLNFQRLAGNTAVTAMLQRSVDGVGAPGSRPNLDVGDSGSGVELLQRLLAINATGRFDETTRQAVVQFQQNHEPPSLHPATGGVGPLTWRALDERAQSGGQPQGQPGSRPNLELGDMGQGVALLQRLLGRQPTAIFDEETEREVIGYQQKRPTYIPRQVVSARRPGQHSTRSRHKADWRSAALLSVKAHSPSPRRAPYSPTQPSLRVDPRPSTASPSPEECR
jgi:hypothetical protein